VLLTDNMAVFVMQANGIYRHVVVMRCRHLIPATAAEVPWTASPESADVHQHLQPGAQPRFQSWRGPIPWSRLLYRTKNTDGIPSFVHCNLQLHKKVGVVRPNFCGVRTPSTPQWLRPCLQLHRSLSLHDDLQCCQGVYNIASHSL